MSRCNDPIWASLLKAGVVQGNPPDAGAIESPWYVKTLLAFSGWLAAFFLLGFIGAGFEFVFKNTVVAFIVGGFMIGAAFYLLRTPKNEFVEHLALAVSIAGQGLAVYGIFRVSDHNEKMAWFLVALLQIPLARGMPHFVHRVFSSFAAVFALSLSLALWGWPYAMGGVVMLLSAVCWLNEFHYTHQMKKIRAVGYGLILALIQFKGAALYGSLALGGRLPHNRTGFWAEPWVGEAMIGGVTLYVVRHLLRRYGRGISDRVSIFALLGTLLVCVVSMKVQGLTVGMVILMLGFAGSNRVLLGLGMISLLFYISSYYYLLDITLLAKSGMLLMVGLLLLIIRWLMRYLFPFQKEAGDV